MTQLKVEIDLSTLWGVDGYSISELIKDEVEKEIKVIIRKHLKNDKTLQSAVKKAATEAATKTLEALTNANP